MLLTILKWGLPVLAIVAIAGVLTHKTFHVETLISASPEQVWNVLMATEEYPDWNPVFVEVDGAYVEGAKLSNNVLDPSGKTLEMTSTVVAMTPERELRQKGGFPGILTFDHSWLLEPVPDGTKVTQFEIDRGIGLWLWNSDWIEPAYATAGDALKKRAEALSVEF